VRCVRKIGATPLTIVATNMVETKAGRPAIDIDPSGTRKEELLLAPDELAVVRRLRKAPQSHGGDSRSMS
jgi:hypothetical protein